MTLQASRPISLGNVATELGIGLPLSLGDARVRTLAGIPSGPISLGNLLGKTRFALVAGASGSLVGFDNANLSSGFGSMTPQSDARIATIQQCMTSNGNFNFVIAGNLPQNYFTSISINGNLFLTASASAFVYFSTATPPCTRWTWASSALTNGNVYNVYIN